MDNPGRRSGVVLLDELEEREKREACRFSRSGLAMVMGSRLCRRDWVVVGEWLPPLPPSGVCSGRGLTSSAAAPRYVDQN